MCKSTIAYSTTVLPNRQNDTLSGLVEVEGKVVVGAGGRYLINVVPGTQQCTISKAHRTISGTTQPSQ